MHWFLLLFCLVPLGCTATCIRDSDCLGKSICSENRCLLIVRGDAGRSVTPPVPSTPGDADGDLSEPPTVDAGATVAPEASGS